MRLDVPKFSGVDPENWIFAINEYFSLLNTSADQRLWIARFEESVKNRFGPSKYEDSKGALSKLLQLGTVEDYQREFEKLMNRVTVIPDSLLISFYISWLKLHLQRELLVSKPTTLGDVFSLARTIEDRFDDQATSVAGTSAGLEANKVVNDGDDSESSGPRTPTSDSGSLGEVKVFNWVQQVIDVESTSDNDARDQASELETKVLVKGKQDEAKVVVVADEQNSDEVIRVGEDDDSGNAATERGDDAVKIGDISIRNSLIGQGISLHKEEKDEGCNAKKIMGSRNQDNFFKDHLEDKVVFKGVESVTPMPNTGKQEKERRTCRDYLKYKESRVRIKCRSVSKKKKSNYSSFQDLRLSCNEDMVKYEDPRPSTTRAGALNERSNKDSTSDLPAARLESLPPGRRRAAR
ncbi:hypothetical protein Tco_1186091 [Tanacetum coccineum]